MTEALPPNRPKFRAIRNPYVVRPTDDPARIAMEKLEQASRLERTRMSEHELTEQQLADEIIQRAENFRRQENLSQGDIAQMAGISETVYSEVVGHKYKANPKKALTAIDAAIDAAEARKLAPGKGEFVLTSVALEIHAVIKTIAQIEDTDSGHPMAVIYGPSGIGKTMALRACLTMGFPNAVYLPVTDECRTPGRLYTKLASVLARRGTSSPQFVVGASAFRWLESRLKGSHRLIILDEAENLSMAALNGIRQLRDQTGCPVLFAGRPPLMATIRRTHADQRMGGGFIGRGAIFRDLTECTRDVEPGDGSGKPLFSQQEIVEILSKKKIRLTRDARRWLTALANIVALDDGREGCGLRYAVWCAIMAAHANRGKEITAEDLQETNALQMGTEYARHMKAEVEQYIAQVG